MERKERLPCEARYIDLRNSSVSDPTEDACARLVERVRILLAHELLTTKSILIGLEVRSPNALTARPKPQYPVLLHAFPVCDPPLYSISDVLEQPEGLLHGVNEHNMGSLTKVELVESGNDILIQSTCSQEVDQVFLKGGLGAHRSCGCLPGKVDEKSTLS
jgi:hypothetical protein